MSAPASHPNGSDQPHPANVAVRHRRHKGTRNRSEEGRRLVGNTASVARFLRRAGVGASGPKTKWMLRHMATTFVDHVLAKAVVHKTGYGPVVRTGAMRLGVGDVDVGLKSAGIKLYGYPRIKPPGSKSTKTIAADMREGRRFRAKHKAKKKEQRRRRAEKELERRAKAEDSASKRPKTENSDEGSV